MIDLSLALSLLNPPLPQQALRGPYLAQGIPDIPDALCVDARAYPCPVALGSRSKRSKAFSRA